MEIFFMNKHLFNTNGFSRMIGRKLFADGPNKIWRKAFM